MSFFYYSANQYQPPLQYYPSQQYYTSPQYYPSPPSPQYSQYYPTPTQYYIQYVYPTPPTPPTQTQSITVPSRQRSSPASRSTGEQSLLQELNILDEAYLVHKY